MDINPYWGLYFVKCHSGKKYPSMPIALVLFIKLEELHKEILEYAILVLELVGSLCLSVEYCQLYELS